MDSGKREQQVLDDWANTAPLGGCPIQAGLLHEQASLQQLLERSSSISLSALPPPHPHPLTLSLRLLALSTLSLRLLALSSLPQPSTGHK